MRRRTALRNVGSASIATLGGCLGDADPPPFAYLAFENEYDEAIRFDVRVTSDSAGANDAAFDRVVTVPANGRRAFEVFERNEQYVLTVTSPHERIELGDCSEILLKACGPNPTVVTVDSHADTGCSIAGCGA